MARLLTVVNERKKIRSLYRAHLEDEYIAQKKKEELDAFLEKREKILEEQGEGAKKEMTPQELKTHLDWRD